MGIFLRTYGTLIGLLARPQIIALGSPETIIWCGRLILSASWAYQSLEFAHLRLGLSVAKVF